MDEKIKVFAALLERETRDRLIDNGCNHDGILAQYKVTVRPGKKYVKVDVGTSGKYMVDAEGKIFGIKAYGVIHRGHQYGTLDTINEYFWGEYRAIKKNKEAA